MRYEIMIIHDLTGEELSQIKPVAKEALIIDANTKAANCIGCFGCWLKTPGKCIFKDEFQDIGATKAQVKEIVVVSQSCYGGYSPSVKKVFERSISSGLPFFTYRGGKIHHPSRYQTRPNFTVYLYGEMSDFEKQIANELVQAHGVNMGARNAKLFFVEEPTQLKEAWQ